MKKPLGLIALCTAFALPALAQEGPRDTNQDPQAARKEMRNARGSQLTPVSPEQAQRNALQRCVRLPDFYRSDCEARVRGQGGNSSGSVVGGGILHETVTTMPRADLDAQMRNHKPITLPQQERAAKPRKPGKHDHDHDHKH